MLKKNNRLKSNSSYIATYSNKFVINSNLLVMYIGKVKENDKNYPTRVGFVVSKKIHKRAVKRNRIKRLIRECIRIILKSNNETINKYQSLIILPKFDISKKNINEVNDSILTLLYKLANNNL